MTYNQITADRRMFELVERKVNELYSDMQVEINKLKSEGIVSNNAEIERGESVMIKVNINNFFNNRAWWYKNGWGSRYKQDNEDIMIMKNRRDDWLKEWSDEL
jgi:hypothetical protein